ncbi:MAG: hypothetical protein ACOX4D_06025 [Bacteroidales bacterium]|jgi:hypothetical protein
MAKDNVDNSTNNRNKSSVSKKNVSSKANDSGKTVSEQKLDYQRYKLRVDFLKWFLASIVLVVITMIIDFGFRDRQAGLKEIQVYDEYVSELLILNSEPGQKRMLAQFFANVTPSKSLRKGWQNYFEIVDKEYQEYIKPFEKNDSLLQEKYNKIYSKSPNFTSTDSIMLKELKAEIEDNRAKIYPKLVLPSDVKLKSFFE